MLFLIIFKTLSLAFASPEMDSCRQKSWRVSIASHRAILERSRAIEDSIQSAFNRELDELSQNYVLSSDPREKGRIIADALEVANSPYRRLPKGVVWLSFERALQIARIYRSEKLKFVIIRALKDSGRSPEVYFVSNDILHLQSARSVLGKMSSVLERERLITGGHFELEYGPEGQISMVLVNAGIISVYERPTQAIEMTLEEIQLLDGFANSSGTSLLP